MCPPNDLLLSLLYILAAETDAGIMLQATEVLRDILDDEMPVDNIGIVDNEDELIPDGAGNGLMIEQNQVSSGAINSNAERNAFLQMFYEHYVPWLTAPFQYSILVSKYSMPLSSFNKGTENKNSRSLADSLSTLFRLQKKVKNSLEDLFVPVEECTMRTSFALELLNDCIKSHSKR